MILRGGLVASLLPPDVLLQFGDAVLLRQQRLGELGFVKLTVDAIVIDQLPMLAVLDDLPVLDDEDLIGGQNCGKPVGDQYAGAALDDGIVIIQIGELLTTYSVEVGAS